MTATIKETAEVKNRKIIVTTYGQRGEAIYPSSHIAFGISDAREALRQIESSKMELRQTTIMRRDALRSGIAQWEAQK